MADMKMHLVRHNIVKIHAVQRNSLQIKESNISFDFVEELNFYDCLIILL